MLRILFAAALICALTTAAEARHRHHYGHHHQRQHIVAVQPTCADMFCLFSTTPQPAARYADRSHWANARPALVRQTVSYGSFDYAIGRPSRFIAGRLACAINVNSALAERGIRGTGSAAALSYLRWGRSAGGPVPGAVIVSSRRGGGHVALVSRVVNGVVMAWNTTGGGGGWREIPYHRRVLDYRVPG
jgi:hypothetical protein